MVWAWARRPVGALGCILMLQQLAAQAAPLSCRGPLHVPIAALGQSVTVQNGKVGGIYPDLLKYLGEGCVEYTVVPRARLQQLFDVGKADLLVPATRTLARDEIGVFVPMTLSRPVLISLATQDRAPVRNQAELLERREMRVAVVRGFDFGPEYRQLVEALASQGRLVHASDVASVARMLDEGIAEATLMVGVTVLGTFQNDAKLRGLIPRLRSEPLPELPWVESGIYVSRHSGLSDKQLLAVVDQLEALSRSGRVWAAFLKRFPPAVLADSTRPRFPVREETGDAQR
ncbi:MAG: hypothetical protein JO006_08535 [Paucibacter sp.]|nr:hypothetical protein [Roseateles sp.]